MNIQRIPALLLLVALIAMPVFGHLDHVPVQLWDESRLAVSALEMKQHGNWLIPTFDGTPDMWSTKPPLMIWLQVFCLDLFGLNEIAIRLPSALAAALTCLLLYFFMKRRMEAPWLGIITVLVLITAPGYVAIHGIRTGDYDSLLAFTMTGQAFCFFLFLEEQKIKFLYGTFFFFALAILTKGIAGMLFAPGLLLYALYQKKVIATLRTRHFYFGLAAFVVIGLGYYLLREHYNPGYLKAVSENELGGRFAKVNEHHSGDGLFYIHDLADYGFAPWYFLIPIGIALGLLNKDRRIKQLTVFTSVILLTHLVIVSLSATKINWYVLPEYPFLAMLAAIPIYTACCLLMEWDLWKQVLTRNILPYLLIVFIFYRPYNAIVDSVTDPEKFSGADESESMSYLLKQALHGERTIDGYTLVWDTYQANLQWYYMALKTESCNIHFQKSDALTGNEKVMAYKEETKQQIINKFAATKLDSFQNVTMYQLNGLR